jgi:hypothetical protein
MIRILTSTCYVVILLMLGAAQGDGALFPRTVLAEKFGYAA